jgi:hypothetical protein
MADESSSTAGKRFSDDLRRIREERDISVDEIHHETQIAETLIESFEAGRLYDHPTYNRVYLRSFVKAYADALSISRDTALECLDAALDGTYDDALASTYLSDRPDAGASPDPDAAEDSESKRSSSSSPDPVDPPDAPTAGGPEGRGGIVGPPRAVGEDPPAKADPDLADAPVEESPPAARGDRPEESTPDGAEAPTPGDDSDEALSSPTESTEESEEPSPSDSEASPPDPSSSTGETPSWMEEGEEGEEDEAPPSPDPDRAPASSSAEDDAPPVGAGESGIVGEATELGSGAPDASLGADDPGASSRPDRVPTSSVTGWASDLLDDIPQVYVTGAGIAVVLLVLVSLGLAYFTSGESEQPSAAAGPADTTMAAAPADTGATAAPERSPADVSLGSTVHLTVLATSNVSALRIQRDEDLRRPYWIQEGEADVFPFQDRVTLESGLSDVRLFVEGYPYPLSPADTTGVLELTRSGLQSFVDTLRGAPASLSVSPDTIPVGAPTQ